MEVNTLENYDSLKGNESNHPPQYEILFQTNQGVKVIALPYKMISSIDREEKHSNMREIKSLQH